ncbi:uncharacterized protein LOC143534363 [Bidens hawaiensis]|uniref:uncharacterized protein LOC143534363 n=1 Tax=Bidens hawaiensis TaxID=980011 RepID=UPI004049FEEF
MATQPASSSATPPPPPPSPQSVRRRSKLFWPLIISLNVSIGAYLYTRPNKEEKTEGDKPATAASSTTTTTNVSPTSVDSVSTSPPAISEPMKPIPMDQQRELLKWILEEKRKVKTKDPQEKKQIDEEKALLKQLIRSKSIPSL